MKAIKKEVIIEQEMIQSCLLEKRILSQTNHQFMVGTKYVFQDDAKIYFIMKFVRGGNLFQLLCKFNHIPESNAKFYAVQIITAFGHLHKCNIVYRDLKLENVMLGEDGYISLIDFGMARYLEKGKLSKSICGTK